MTAMRLPLVLNKCKLSYRKAKGDYLNGSQTIMTDQLVRLAWPYVSLMYCGSEEKMVLVCQQSKT